CVVVGALEFSRRMVGRHRHRRLEGRAGGSVRGATLIWLRPFAWLRRSRRPLAGVTGGIVTRAPAAVTAPTTTPAAMPVTIVHALSVRAAARAQRGPASDPKGRRSARLPAVAADRRAPARDAAPVGIIRTAGALRRFSSAAAPDVFAEALPVRVRGRDQGAPRAAPRAPARAPVTL